jgi:phospholipid-binding lipoprotein MlaA
MALDSLRIGLSAAMLGSLLLAGCASVPREPSMRINDPYEASNRKSLAFNQSVFGPISRGYHAATPSVIRQGIGNVSANLNEPRVFANDLLQLRLDAGSKTVARFLVNSTFGVGGLFDVATTGNILKQSGDFGQTLFVWGVDDGPYLVSPFFGPATTRDAVGLVVDEVGDPASWALSAAFGNPAAFGLAGLDFVTQIDQLKQAEDSSIDFYSFLRSSYYQTRRAQLREAIGLPSSVESPADIGATAPAPHSHQQAGQ